MGGRSPGGVVQPATTSDPTDTLVGATLAHYHVLGTLGRGGMGVVYRARDLRLRRTVALKVLALDLTDDEDRKRRFLREARAAAAVSHPTIATVYDAGEVDGVVYLAMELVAGTTLREVLGDGALPPERAVGVGRRIARGLAEAHGAGVVHRDVKPENIMLGPNDQVKLLDFGLAKPTSLSAERASLVHGDTVSQLTTREGRILGTPEYMSPEQARGATVDVRTDVFALGIVLYEMLTGTRPFVADTPLGTLVAISTDEPEPLPVRCPQVPPGLARVVHKCLEKPPDARYGSAAELVDDLEALTGSSGELPVPTVPPRRRLRLSHRSLWWGVATTLTAVGLGVPFSGMLLEPSQVEGGTRSTPEPAAATPTVEGRAITLSSPDDVLTTVSLSPDGRRIAYASRFGGKLQVRSLRNGPARAVTLPPGHRVLQVDWFPDSERLLTSELGPAGLALYEQSLGKDGRVLVHRGGHHGAVSPDGRRIAFVDDTGLRVLDRETDELTTIATLSIREVIYPVRWSPSGQQLVWARGRSAYPDWEVAIELASLDDPRPRTVVRDLKISDYVWGVGLAMPDDDRLLFMRGRTPERRRGAGLWEQRLDREGYPRGEPHEIVEWDGVWIHSLSLSADGRTLTGVRLRSQVDTYVVPIAPDGTLTGEPADWHRIPRAVPGGWTPSNKLLVAADREGGWTTYRYDRRGTAPRVVHESDTWSSWPVATAGGTVLFWEVAPIERVEPRRARLLRASGDDGPPVEVATASMSPNVVRLLFPAPVLTWLRCAQGAPSRCIVSEIDGARARFTEVDPKAGRGPQVAEVELPGAIGLHTLIWDLSPDGRTVVAVTGRGAPLLLSLEDGTSRRIPLDVPARWDSVGWTADGEGFYLGGVFVEGHPYKLLLARPDGSRRTLLESESRVYGRPVAAPDGTRLALYGITNHTDVLAIDLH